MSVVTIEYLLSLLYIYMSSSSVEINLNKAIQNKGKKKSNVVNSSKKQNVKLNMFSSMYIKLSDC